MSMEPFFAQLRNGQIPTEEESMKYEALRLATFHTRPLAFSTPAPKLSNAGFHYTGFSDIVACSKCKLQVGDWQSMGRNVDPIVVHKIRSPNCAFLTNNKTENVPYFFRDVELPNDAKQMKQEIAKVTKSHHANKSTKTKQTAESLAPTPSGNVPITTRRHDNAETESTEVSPVRAPNSSSNTNTTSEPAVPRQDNVSAPAPFYNFPPPQPMFDNDPPMPDFKDEQVRFETYSYWPNRAAARPEELAKAGFYYLGTEDRVQCAFCKGVLRNWEPTDRARNEHKKHFPACPFLKDPKAAGNIPRVNTLNGVHMRKDLPIDEDIDTSIIGVMVERAYHPHMATTVERLNSFVNFQSDSTRTPEEFADAGFFSTGQGDNVKCFFCDGGLRNWERNDDPWLEHARWFPKCGYLLTKKGEEYVKEIRKRYSPPGTNKPRIKKLKQRYEVKEGDVDEFMRGDIAKDAKEIGYPLLKIEIAVHRRFAELGEKFPNLESLIDALLEAEELEQQGSNSDSDSAASEDAVCNKEKNLEKNVVNSKSEQKKHKKKKRNKKRNNAVDHVNPIELMSEEKGAKLATEVQKMKEERLCKVCMDGEVNIVFLKCGHLVCCSDCAPALRNCPICRDAIRGTIRVFLS